ncbi:hypothetical protein SEA_MOLIVIA_53 [Arthrobacter phage Molivia]|uniref:Uncharacterized protein n=1 Tax=Arthrobacter phage Molivia TaxID=2015839 RepID=A0A286S1U4_9CAUD|nr:hypothetical protein FDI28_gp61 [Arthrobacter phage Molivia]ASX99277.1 hypothetical protein SEA_MOLIVIA_53 [Arthrobacter phage Molivia]
MTKSAMQELAESLGLTAEEFSEFAKAIESVDVSPKAELMHRLNLRVQDIDPGPSINWPGDRAILELWDHRPSRAIVGPKKEVLH